MESKIHNTEGLSKEFLRYVIPSMFAFALSGLYGIIDGFFLGNEMGDHALAAINVAFPLTAFLQAVGTGIGMGGAVQYTINKAQKKKENQERILGITLLSLTMVGLLFTPLLYCLNIPLLRLLGAKGELLTLGSEYMKWISLGSLFQILGTGMIPFIRNLSSASISMIAMAVGAIANIAGDYFFIWIWKHGMAGAAISSVMGQAAAFLVCLGYLKKKKEKMRLSGDIADTLKKIIMIGCSPFGLSFAPNITLILVNLNAIRYGGSFAVTCYAPISYITFTIMLLLQGVSDGCQPLVSFFYGKGDWKKAGQAYRMSKSFSLFVGITAFVILYLSGSGAAAFFGASSEVTEYVTKVLPIFLIGMVFSGLSRAAISFFYATEKNIQAYIMIYMEQLLLFLLLCLLPGWMGIMGTWISVMISQITIALIGMFMMKKADKSRI